MLTEQRAEVLREAGAIAVRTSPGGIMTAATWGDWVGLLVGVLTAIFLTLQIAHFVWTRDWKRNRDK